MVIDGNDMQLFTDLILLIHILTMNQFPRLLHNSIFSSSQRSRSVVIAVIASIPHLALTVWLSDAKLRLRHHHLSSLLRLLSFPTDGQQRLDLGR